MGKTIVKWMILTALLTCTVILTVWAGNRAQASMCQGIEVVVEGGDPRGAARTRRGVYNEVLRFDSHLLQKRAASINTLALQQHLSRISNFESVSCLVTSQGKLRVTVVPMIPEIRVFDGNESYYINKDGKRIAANAEFFADVPVVRGRFTKDFPPTSVLPVVRFVRNDSTLKHLVSMFEAKDADDILLIPRVAGHVINFGDASGLERKRRALMAIYRNVMPYKGWEEYDTISVKFRGQVVATRRDKSAAAHSAVLTEEADLEEASLAAHSGAVRADIGAANDSTQSVNEKRKTKTNT